MNYTEDKILCKERCTKMDIILHRDDVETILQFSKKYPQSEYVTIMSDSDGGIGTIITASISIVLHDDDVTITKSIVDTTSW